MGEDWFTYADLYKAMVNKFPTGSRFVELGCWKGKSAAFMAVEILNSSKQIYFDCIDSWPDSACEHDTLSNAKTGQELYDIFMTNISPVLPLINIRRMDSSSASNFYWNESVDFVFVDADHTYEGVKKDIMSWWPKIKKGGVLAGHDYAWHDHIQRAVNELFGDMNHADPWGCGCFYIKK